MAAFDDSFDPALGAACNRLAAWVETLPEGVVVDAASGLSEDDLAMILRHLYATRHDGPGGPRPASAPAARASVPVTARG
ncbi:hypothetical protein NZL82_10620 [Sphingomonas sanguinis]|jgi:hypothetical protein|uniref:hypothetical protein n=1 Tax=Sphingomonas sp. LC-1 TaxID=3110957 RepID=UPI0021BA5453|nr:hypothetical protein [Sphingomonas sp. LC-1]MCT8002332.1 hypothetical protein [Sphingomonas sp. LC-1]